MDFTTGKTNEPITHRWDDLKFEVLCLETDRTRGKVEARVSFYPRVVPQYGVNPCTLYGRTRTQDPPTDRRTSLRHGGLRILLFGRVTSRPMFEDTTRDLKDDRICEVRALELVEFLCWILLLSIQGNRTPKLFPDTGS